tara:strand:+ start:1456 stop:3225 length:1770 start_codon:yes stop_codon:yes gene_type:complete
MSSYWKVDDTMRIGQKYISIPSENGLDYSPEQKIQLFVDPSTKFMSGQDSYLEFNLKLKMPAGSVPTKLQLDQLGGNALIRNIRIYDGSRGVLLEEIESYSSLCSVRYDYDTDDSTRNYRALREGSGVHNIANRGTRGTSHSVMANTMSNPYFKQVSGTQTLAGTPWNDDSFLTAKLCIPLHTGIFAQNEHIFPVMMTNGLYIEIDTPPASEVVKQLDSVLRHRRIPLNPFFHSIDGSVASPASWPQDATARGVFYVMNRNNLTGVDAVSHFPFCVGETFKFVNDLAITPISVMSGEMKIKTIEYVPSSDDASVSLIKITLDTNRSNNGVDSFAITSGNFVMYSTAVEDASSYEPSYEISNVNLVVSQIELDPGYERGMVQKVREGKNIELDILTATNYKNSILASDRQTTFQINAQNSRAKSLLVIPQDSSVYSAKHAITGTGTYEILKSGDSDDGALFSNRSSLTGICDELKDIQFQLGMRLHPSRAIDVSKIASRQSIDAFHLYQLEKTLDNAGIVPRSFRAFKDNFVFGMGFGVNQGARDLRGEDLSVILKYTGSGIPQKGKLFNSYIVSVRRLLIGSGQVQVVF